MSPTLDAQAAAAPISAARQSRLSVSGGLT